jgi:hypothetical protein
MANIRNPLFGVKKDENTLTTQDPAAVLYGVTSDNQFIPIKITDTGEIVIGADVVLDASDIQIGAVEIKNHDTDDRVHVTPNNEMLTISRLYDSNGVAFTATDVGLSHGLDVNIIGGVSSPTDLDDGSIAGGQTVGLSTGLNYGWDGLAWERLTSNSGALNVSIAGGAVDVNIDNADDDILMYGQDSGLVNRPIRTNTSGQLEVSVISSVLPTGAATELSLDGFRTDFNATDFATETTLASVESNTDNLDVLLSTRASEATLADIKAQTDQLTFAAGRLVVDASQVAVPVTDNGGSLTVDGAVTVSGAVDVSDRLDREVGRVTSSDVVFTSESYLTTGTDASARPINGDFNVRRYKTKTISIRNTGANSARITILGSIDDGVGFDVVISSNTLLSSGNVMIVSEERAMTHIQVLARANAGGNQTTIVTKGYALGT